MILYLDTSAFLKLYLEESESGKIRAAIERAGLICTHMIAYVEMRAAFARAIRVGRLSGSDATGTIREFEADWLKVDIIGIDEPLIRRAGAFAENYGLRGYDSVHLAAAARAYEISETGFLFASFDKTLCAAADALGLARPA